MKKIITISFSLIICLLLFSGCASGENVKISHEYDSMVSFYTKCPSCGHLEYEQVNISSGESYGNSTICNSCGEVFSYSVNR